MDVLASRPTSTAVLFLTCDRIWSDVSVHPPEAGALAPVDAPAIWWSARCAMRWRADIGRRRPWPLALDVARLGLPRGYTRLSGAWSTAGARLCAVLGPALRRRPCPAPGANCRAKRPVEPDYPRTGRATGCALAVKNWIIARTAASSSSMYTAHSTAGL